MATGSLSSSLSPSSRASSSEADKFFSSEPEELELLTDGEECSSSGNRAGIDYQSLFELPKVKPTSQSKCLARCRICRKVYKYTLDSKGNLLKHLRNVHPKQLDKHKDERAKQLSENCGKAVPSGQCTFSKDGRIKVSREPFKNQDKIVTSIVKNFCGKGGLPLSIVEQDWFRNFMHLVEPKFQNVSRVSVSSRLEEIYKEEKRNMLDEISTSFVHKPTMTVDFWTGCNGKSYLGSTVHYVHEKKLKSHTLFFVEVKPPHTSENIKAHFEDQLDNFNIRCFLVVTDNASNMKHAFELMVETDEDSACDESDEEQYCDLDRWAPIELKIEGWIGCSAHQLQLVVNEGYSELKGYHRIQNILSKAKLISSLSRKSSHFSYLLSRKVPKPCETRWNSYFRLYKHIVKYFTDINEALLKVNENNLIISTPQKEILELIVSVMSYFNEATNILQQEATPTSNSLIPVIDSLENALLQIDRANPAINALCERLLSSLRRRFSYLLNSEIYLTATALDPQMKLSFTDNNKEGKFFIFSSSLVKQAVKSLLPRPLPVNSSPAASNASLEPASKKIKLLDFCSVSDDGVSVKDIDVEVELQTYFDQPRLSDVNPITFWAERKETQLSTLALQVLSVPCSSAPVERLFSRAGIILSQRRSRLNSDKLEKLVFIK